MFKPLRTILATVLLGAAVAPALAEDIRLRIASGHPAANTYVNLIQNFFVPGSRQAGRRADLTQGRVR